MKKSILELGKALNQAEQKKVKGGVILPWVTCLTDKQCPYCHTCEEIFNNHMVCVGNC